MKWRSSRAGSEPVKTLRRKTLRPKRRNALNATPDRTPSAVDLQEQVDALSRALKEAREQQIATSEVLNVIRRSPADAEPVFDAIVESAARNWPPGTFLPGDHLNRRLGPVPIGRRGYRLSLRTIDDRGRSPCLMVLDRKRH